ncbi:MAG: hypothetical protein HYZ57_16000 [Acidobacteria bacterium]|nr:hypothetical protein [Acidobacteriota bacterium]
MHNINLEHPDYKARKAMWGRYRDLYVGGEQIKTNASRYLVQRHKEAGDVYAERLERVFYENYIGSIIDWYAATLFRREPVLHVEGANERGRRFFSAFTEDCDAKGTNLSDFYRRQMIDALVFGSSYALVDFPRVRKPAKNLAEEEAQGASRAYLVGFTPENLINWSHDERGNWNWVVLRNSYLRQQPGGEWAEEQRWVYYDRREYRVFRKAPGAEAPIELVDHGAHGLAALNLVPLFELKISEGLWLMNKAGLLQLEHFNKSNALAWALTMGLFAMPVVYTERQFNQIVGESYYIQLAPDDRFGWTEPEGKVYQIAVENLQRLQEEIYRICYLMHQAGNSNSSGLSQSGLSKLRDFAITQEVLRAYGDAAKDVLKRVLRAVEAARGDGLAIDVSGLDDFDIADFSTDLENAQKLLSAGIESPTLRKQVFRRLAQKYLCDVRQEVKEQIAAEIDAAA